MFLKEVHGVKLSIFYASNLMNSIEIFRAVQSQKHQKVKK